MIRFPPEQQQLLTRNKGKGFVTVTVTLHYFTQERERERAQEKAGQVSIYHIRWPMAPHRDSVSLSRISMRVMGPTVPYLLRQRFSGLGCYLAVASREVALYPK